MSHAKATLVSLLCLLAVLCATPLAAGELPDFTRLVERNSPGVVNVSTTRKHKPLEFPDNLQIPDLPDSEALRDFLRRFLERHPGGEGGEPGLPEGPGADSLGSGCIISADGYIITNHHVIDGADEITVRLSDRREFRAEVIGSDPRSDIALLKIDATDLPVLRLGSSEKLKVGEWVLAIGSPFGFEHSATAGIVSAKGRSLPSEQYVPFIQTDVAINPGNSGGPLFNLDGEVVGINSQIYSRTGGFMGLSFAIPIDVAMDVVQQLKETGEVTRGWLGVYIQEVTKELADSFGMAQPRGALVAQVLPDSPAAKAGIQVGDIILALDGRPVQRSSDLPPMVGRYRVGRKAEVTLLREGREIRLPVVIEALPEEGRLRAAGGGPDELRMDKLGLVLAPLDEEHRRALHVEQGVLVARVTRGPARDAGLRSGDVIVRIDNKPVADLDAFRERIGAIEPGHSVALLVQRKGGPVFIPLRIPK